MAGLFAPDVPIVAVGYAQVALEQGIDATATGLTYAIPQTMAELRVGDRVIVPLGRGNKPTHGYVTAIDAMPPQDVPASKLKSIRAKDVAGLSLPLDLIELARWIASYYICPLGMVFATMLPAAVKRGTGTMRETLIEATEVEPAKKSKLTKLQKAVLDAVKAHPEPLEIHHLAYVVGAKTITPIRLLVKHGLLRAKQHSIVRADWDELVEQAAHQRPAITLTSAQQAALDHLFANIHCGFGVHLLHGVTGSGKTEVYLRLIDRVLQGDEDRGAILLVPEIALTPQTAARFIERFTPGKVAVLHSALTAAQRHEEWRRIRDGKARIIVGARSAIFAPVERVGVIIVDEEHESSYKQDQLPRYHARDVAIKRAQALGVPIVLGSATPSLESYANAVGIRGQESGVRDQVDPKLASDSCLLTPRSHWHLLRLPERVAGLKLPVVELVNLADERRKRYEMTGKGGIHLLSLRLEKVMQQTIVSGGQVMLLLNRRGYANYISCPDHRCGWLKTCDYCDATMVYHKDQRLPDGGVVKCHHCEAEQMLPRACPMCGKKVTTFGLGTQRVEEEIASKFPGVSYLRMDSDTMRTGRDYHISLEAFRRGEVKILLGTQMIAKGLDFPNVRVVGVISADTALNLPDFRAAERTFQLIAQVAGRAGRGEHPGRVIVQTFSPDDPAIVLASQHNYDAFSARELAIRAQVGLPPATRMARIVTRHRDHAACLKLATDLAELLHTANAASAGAVRIRGPMPAPIARIAEFHRQQLELIAPDAATLQKLLTTLRNQRQLISDMHTAIDVDPVALL